MLRRPAHETVKIGADNPDNYYQSAAISGAHEYRIRGKRNTVHYLGLGTYAGSYGSKARRGQTGYLDAREMKIAADGSFEIVLSCDEPAGTNWLRMEPDTSSLIVRQTFQDRANETIAELRIERLGGARCAGTGDARLHRPAGCRPPPRTSREPRRSSRTGRRASRSTRTSCRASTRRSPPRRTAIRTSSTTTATSSWRTTRRW